MSISGKKMSQFAVITNILTTSFVPILQNGINCIASIQSLFSNYYTRSQVDQIIENLSVGGVPWQEKVYEDVAIPKSTLVTITHNCNNINARWTMLEWNTDYGKYLQSQWPPTEADRTENFIKVFSNRDIDKCKIVVFG